jgi:hypothetical protein
MAIDTAAKRASATLVNAHYQALTIIPDSTIAQADRQSATFSYGGIAAGAIAYVTIKATQAEIDALSNVPADWPRASEHRRLIAAELNRLIDIFQESSTR